MAANGARNAHCVLVLCITWFGRKRDSLRVSEQGIVGCMLSNICQTFLQEVGGGRGDWMELAQDRDGWRALVGTVRDFRVS